MTQMRILVVDDLPTNRMMVKAALSADGYAVTEAEDGEAALAALQDDDFDLIILDHMMPGLSGMEVLTAVRARLDADHLPIMVVSGEDEEGTIEDFLAAGANDFMTKPYDFSLLAARVRTLTGYKRALQALRRPRQ